MPEIIPPIRVVCLDAYGTLVRITDRRDPYRTLFRRARVGPRAMARLVTTTDRSLADLVRDSEADSDFDLSGTVKDLDAEVASVRLFDDVSEALTRLRQSGLKLWVASNLAPPYAEPVRALLTDSVDGYCFSFEVGSIKPEARFFEALCAKAGYQPAQTLMVGDSLGSDMEGARAFGMQAVHLARDGGKQGGSVASLTELAERLERIQGG